jgi:hypothetical protein
MAIENKRMFQLVDTAPLWASNNPVLGDGEFSKESDTGAVKIGDGTTQYNSLAVVAVVGAGIDYLSDVDTTTSPPNDGDVLTFNTSSGKWIPQAP